jgi:hypothetical protein
MKPPSTISFLLLLAFLISGHMVMAVEPVITVRFANPEYYCSTQTYTVDVEFQSDTDSTELFGMNVRFFYPDLLLEFISFDEFAVGYGAITPNPPIISTGGESSGMAAFGFPGSQEYINGAISKIENSDTTYLSTSGWTKLFNISFHVDDSSSINNLNFCPSLIWDLNEAANGGITPSAGVVMTVVTVYPNTAPAIEHCIQFNWQYDGIPGLPYGFPVNTNCINTICAYAPKTHLPVMGAITPGLTDIPVMVTNCNNIKAFTLVFDYDPAVITYVDNSPNPVFSAENGLLTVTDAISTGGKKKITLAYDGNLISLADSAHLTDLHFNYISGTTDLLWTTDGTSCEFVDAYGYPAFDLPYSDYYINGKVISLEAPVTELDTIAAYPGNYVTFTVKVWDYIDILSGHLTLNYNPAVLNYFNGIPDAAISSSFEASAMVPGTLIVDYASNDTSLADGTALMYLTFLYLGGSSSITWNNSGNSCQYVNAELLLPLNDDPATDHYMNGYITNVEFVWNGETSGDWNTASNWSDNLIPFEPVDVIIDPAANPAFWPIFTGNFIIGEDCNNLTIMDNAHVTITGDCIINPGRILNIIGTGQLTIGGNWINSGTFNPGEGTVEFTGSDDAQVANGVLPANYISGYELSTFPLGFELTLPGEASVGPSGDDAHLDVGIGFDFNYLGVNYSQVRINTNGWASLNLTGDDESSYDNMLLFNSSGPSAVLAPWWDDLKTGNFDNIRYKMDGTAPFRVFIIEWRKMYSYKETATTRIYFSVRLYETSGIIEFLYGNNNIAGTHHPDESASIGIKDLTGGPGHFIEATQNSSYIMMPVLNSSNTWPTVNYRFTPTPENTMEVFYNLVNNKSDGDLKIQKDATITGIE